MRQRAIFSFLLSLFASCSIAMAQPAHAPDRREGEGQGPFDRLVIRGVILVDGSGAPPRGPVDIVIEGNRIAAIRSSREQAPEADHVLEADGMYVLPGFVDMHAHTGGTQKAPNVEYCYKLWLAHGVTTVRGVPLGPNDWVVEEKRRSAAGEIVAPRIFNYQVPSGLETPEEARAWVERAPARGIDGMKLFGFRPEIMEVLLGDGARFGLGSTAHLDQGGVAQMNALHAARLGLDTVTHYYGHFEALLKDHVIQPWPVDHNHANEQHRFGQVARLWNLIHPPGSKEWEDYLEEQLELGTVFDPTFNIYSAGRDLMRARTAEWHEEYTLPSLWDFFQPSEGSHGSFFFDWTTEDEVAWRNFYQVWFRLVNDYKKLGGRITTGSDSGFIYKTWGFGYIEELELLQEAGLHPLEVIQAATYNGALTLHEPKGKPIDFGVVQKGLLADLIVVRENPLANLKVLYATGSPRLDPKTGELGRTRGILWTVKDGIVYDAKKLLADVRSMVEAQRRERRAKAEGGGE